MARNDGQLIVITGRSRTGKTWLTSRLTESAGYRFIYDPKGDPNDYPRAHVVKSPALMIKAIAQGKHHIRLVDRSTSSFAWFCKFTLRFIHKYGPCVVIADELASVTTPAKAPHDWGQLCRTALGFGADVYAITQRPAESDKTCFSNASRLITFHMQRSADRQYMAKEMDVPKSNIDALQELEYIESFPGGSYKKHKLQHSRRQKRA